MKYIIPTLLLVLLGCANNEEYAPSSSANVSTSPVKNYHGDNISGTKFSSPQTATTKSAEIWKTDCYDNEDNHSYYFSFSFVDNDISVKTEEYSDIDCVTNYAVEDEKHTYSIDIDSKTYLVTMGSTIKITPQSDSAVNLYNKDSKWDYNDWKLNVTKNCGPDDREWNTGDSLYCSYYYTDYSNPYGQQQEEDVLYTTCDKNSYPTSEFTKFTRE